MIIIEFYQFVTKDSHRGVILKPKVLVVEPPCMARTSCFSLLFANPGNHMKLFLSPKRFFIKEINISFPDKILVAYFFPVRASEYFSSQTCVAKSWHLIPWILVHARGTVSIFHWIWTSAGAFIKALPKKKVHLEATTCAIAPSQRHSSHKMSLEPSDHPRTCSAVDPLQWWLDIRTVFIWSFWHPFWRFRPLFFNDWICPTWTTKKKHTVCFCT